MTIQERLSRVLVESHPAEAAVILERLAPADSASLLARLPAALAAGALASLAPAAAVACLAAWPGDGVGPVLDALPHGVAARILARLPQAERDRALDCTPRKAAEALRRLLRYPEGTAGALMDPRAPTLPREITAAEARRRVRRHARQVLYYVYVVDREQRLVGVFDLRDLMSAPADVTVDQIMHADVQRLSVLAGRGAILSHPGWRDHHALPVTDANDVLVGVLRYGTLRRLEAERDRAHGSKAVELGLTLGELYWTAAFALLREVMAVGAAEGSRHGPG